MLSLPYNAINAFSATLMKARATTAKNGSMDQSVCTQQNDRYGHACIRKNPTNVINGELCPNFDLFNNAHRHGFLEK